MVTYKGLPPAIICDYLSHEASKEIYAEGTEFQIGRVDMVVNTGAYIDCPYHRFRNGKDYSEIGVEAFVDVEGITIDAMGVTEVGIEFFKGRELRNRAVLVNTGWSRNWNTEQYFEGHSYLTKEAATYLRDSGVKMVGIDSLNIDDIRDKTRPVHTIL